MNSVLKNVYDHYCCDGGVITPSDMKNIKKPELFSNSIMLHKEPHVILDKGMIDPVEFSRGIQATGINRIFEMESTKERVIVTKKDQIFKYGVTMDEFQLEDMKKYQGIKHLKEFIPDEYPIHWEMDEITKNDLLEYRVPCINLGEFNGNSVNMIVTVKVFPAIKKADKIEIFAYPIDPDNDIYEAVIHSVAKTWSFYSFHRIINIEAE